MKWMLCPTEHLSREGEVSGADLRFLGGRYSNVRGVSSYIVAKN